MLRFHGWIDVYWFWIRWNIAAAEGGLATAVRNGWGFREGGDGQAWDPAEHTGTLMIETQRGIGGEAERQRLPGGWDMPAAARHLAAAPGVVPGRP